jgi:hypothetical protein
MQAMYSMNLTVITNPEKASATYGVSQDLTVRMGMSWDKSQAGMSTALNVAKVDLQVRPIM